MIYKTVHRKLNIEQREPIKNMGVKVSSSFSYSLNIDDPSINQSRINTYVMYSE
jgi:hypothetical protein